MASAGAARAAGAVGGRLMLNGRPLTIVGVLPPAFAGTEPFSRVDVWYPGATYAYVNHFGGPPRWTTRADGLFHSFIVRLAPDASFAMAQAELDVLVRGLAVSHPKDNRELESVRARLFEGLGPPVLQRERYQRLVRVLLAVGGALLLLGCANVANLLMVRSVGRRREHAVRMALGASPGRLLLLHLTEALLLAAGGAALGVALAVWLKQFVATLLLPAIAAGPDFIVPLDTRVLAMALGVSIGCGLAAGFVPPLLGTRNTSAGALGDAGGRSVTGTRRVRAGFAVAQLALSLALVTGALMLVATLRNLNAIDLGFEAAGVTTHGMDPSGHGYPPDRASVYYRTMMERLRDAPGFESLSIGARAPFGPGRIMQLQDPAGGERDPIEVSANAVSGAYFDVLGMRIVRGRAFTDTEALTPAGGSAAAIVSENLARRLFGDTDPIGKGIVFPRTAARPARELTVIGVAPDVHCIGLAFLGSRLVEAQLYGLTRLEPAVYVVAAASLAVVVLLAGLWPARTATRIEPVEALRIE